MPKRHGIYRVDDKAPPWGSFPWFLVGIHLVFDAVAHSGFITDDASKREARSLEYHFRRIQTRLAFALDLLQRGMREWENLYNLPFDMSDILVGGPQTAGVAADSVMNYINIFIDDVARVVPFALEKGSPLKLESFNQSKNMVTKNGRFPSLKPLFDILEDPKSWWELAIKRGVGIRQRLVHFKDVIEFQGFKGPDDEQAAAQAFLVDPFSQGAPIKFIKTLQLILASLCDWLDGLEVLLLSGLSCRASVAGITWTPPLTCHRVLLPVEIRVGERMIPEGYLYLPLCDGSLSSQCTVSFIAPGSGENSLSPPR